MTLAMDKCGSRAATRMDVVRRAADGLWSEVLRSNGTTAVCEYNFWVDFQLAPGVEPETLGVIWTDNGGARWHVVTASMYADLMDGEQLWGVNVRPCGDAFMHRESGLVSWHPVGSAVPFNVESGRVKIQYSIFCRANGVCHWDNNHGAHYSFEIGHQQEETSV